MVTSISVSSDTAAKPSNPWVSPLHLDSMVGHSSHKKYSFIIDNFLNNLQTPLQKRKESKLKQILNERDRARKSAAEYRRKDRRYAHLRP